MGCGRACLSIVFLLLVVGIASPFTSLFVGASGGAYRTPITITEQSGHDLTDYQVKIVLDSSWDGWSNVAQDGSDIYFMDSSGNPLYYHIESWDYANQQAVIWVKVPNIPTSSSTTIYMYYGGDNPYSSYNDPNEVFDFYDDFSTDPFSGRWAVVSGSWTWDSDNKIIYEDSDVLSRIKRPFNDQGNFVYELELRHDEQGTYNWVGLEIKSPNTEYDDYDQGYLILLYGSTDNLAKVLRADAGTLTLLAQKSITQNIGIWYKLTVIYIDGTIKLLVNDEEVLSVTDTTYTTGEVIRIWNNNKNLKHSYNYIRIRKYVDPEPSVSIGSSEAVSQGVYPWFSASVSPTSVSVEPSDTISFDVNVTNTGGAGGWVVVELRDHNNVARDSANITLDPDAWQVVTLSIIANEDERGDWDWFILGYNDTTTFFNISVSVSIHYSLEYSYSYVLDPSANINASSVAGIRYNYSVGFNASSAIDWVGGSGYSRVWGLKYGLVIYTNSSGSWETVYEERGATVYTLYIRFVYNVTAPYPDVPDASIKVYDADTGELLSTIYVPFGNTSLVLYADRYYRFEIPGSGATVHGYCFRLNRYLVDGVVNPASVLLDRDSTLTIYYDILNGTCSGDDPYGASFSSVNIGTVGSRVGVYSFSGSIYGGDVFEGYTKIVNGLIEERNLSSNWFSFGSYDSVVVQYYSSVSTPVKGAGFYEGGNYFVVGYYMNVSGSDTRIVGGRFLVDVSGGLRSIVYVYQDAWLENYQSYGHYGKLVFYKGNVLAMIYANGQWYRLAGSLNNTAVSYAVFIGDYHPSSVLIMRGDYIVFQAPGLKAVEITGVDAAGNPVSIAVADNAPGDADPREGIIMVQELPVLYPLNATIRLFLESVGEDINYGLPGISSSQWVNMSWGNITITTGNSSLVDAVKNILEHPYGRIILGLLPIVLMLYPNRKYGAIMGLFAVGLLGFFNIVAVASGMDPVVEPASLVLSFIVLVFGLFYEVK